MALLMKVSELPVSRRAWHTFPLNVREMVALEEPEAEQLIVARVGELELMAAEIVKEDLQTFL